MRDRAILALAYTTIVATIIAGTFAVSWWAAIACAAVLALISLIAPFGSYSQYVFVGSPVSPTAVFTSTTINAASAAATAYVLGRAVGYLLGL